MHFYYFREAWRSINKHRGLVITAILSLTAALTLLGMFLLAAHNANYALDLLGDRREMVVYLKDDLTPAVRDSLIGHLHALYGSATYVSKSEAWDELRQQVGDPALLDAVGQNPLPASLRVRLRPELLNYPAMREAARQVAQFPEVEDVRYGDEWVRRLDEMGDIFRRGALAVGLVVGLAFVFIMQTVLRLSVLARRSQVEVMLRLGASDRFIATPFVLEAMFEALVASLLALLILFALQQAVVARVVAVVFFPPLYSVAFVGAAVVLAWLTAAWALSRVLRTVGP